MGHPRRGWNTPSYLYIKLPHDYFLILPAHWQ